MPRMPFVRFVVRTHYVKSLWREIFIYLLDALPIKISSFIKLFNSNVIRGENRLNYSKG